MWQSGKTNYDLRVFLIWSWNGSTTLFSRNNHDVAFHFIRISNSFKNKFQLFVLHIQFTLDIWDFYTGLENNFIAFENCDGKKNAASFQPAKLWTWQYAQYETFHLTFSWIEKQNKRTRCDGMKEKNYHQNGMETSDLLGNSNKADNKIQLLIFALSLEIGVFFVAANLLIWAISLSKKTFTLWLV